jgi:DNA-binding NarL/FixJ family response regulator
MAISRGKELLRQVSPDANEIKKSIEALEKDKSHVRKCIKAGLRDYDSGQASIDEISGLIEQLKQKL